jgi:hypothetical protein
VSNAKGKPKPKRQRAAAPKGKPPRKAGRGSPSRDSAASNGTPETVDGSRARTRANDIPTVVLLDKMDQRYLWVAMQMAQGHDGHELAGKIKAEYGVKWRQAFRYMEQANRRYLANNAEALEIRRAKLRAMAQYNFRVAHGKERWLVSEGRVFKQPDPDVRSATATLDFLGKLDNVVGEREKDNKLQETPAEVMAAMRKHYGMPELPAEGEVIEQPIESAPPPAPQEATP